MFFLLTCAYENDGFISHKNLCTTPAILPDFDRQWTKGLSLS